MLSTNAIMPVPELLLTNENIQALKNLVGNLINNLFDKERFYFNIQGLPSF